MDLDKTEITIENRLNFGDFNRLWLYPMAPLKRLALIIVGCLLAALLPEIIIKHQIDVFNAVYWFCAAFVLNFVGPLALMRGTGIDCNANLKFTPEAIIAGY